METWTYYGYMVALLAVMLIASRPRRRVAVPNPPEVPSGGWAPAVADTLTAEGSALADIAG